MECLMNRLLSCSCLSAGFFFCAGILFADTFGSGGNSFDIDFVTIGNPGNPPDANPNPAGVVQYSYRIGKYEISEQMIDKANSLGGLGITKDTRGPDTPATSVTWYEAAKFVNWLNSSSGSAPAYKFDGSGNFQLWTPSDAGYDPNNLFRNSLAKYFLPSLNEWHKAAYYDQATSTYFSYPTGSNSAPDGIDFVGDPNFDAVFYDGGLNSGPNIVTNVGLLSPYGTAGQGGNVYEWDETAFDRMNRSAGEGRDIEGGSWGTAANVLSAAHTGIGIMPTQEGDSVGIRIGSVVPEPATILLFGIGFIGILTLRTQQPYGRDAFMRRSPNGGSCLREPLPNIALVATVWTLIASIAQVCHAGAIKPGDIVVVDEFVPGLFAVDKSTGDRTVLSSGSIGTGPAMTSPLDIALRRGDQRSSRTHALTRCSV
jgi:sulfatase modifying factor 1